MSQPTSTTAQEKQQNDEQPLVCHEVSKWQEPLGDPWLTMYDLHRKPRALDFPEKNQRMRLPVNVLRSDFRCAICHGYLKKTMVVMECLHRFCEECIVTSIRLAKKECPSCRVPIPSRRSLRRDERFDAIISSILGDVQVLDDIETKQIVLFNLANHMGRKTQQETRRQRSIQAARANAANAMDEKQWRSTEQTTLVKNFQPSPLVDFLLVRHPRERKLDPLPKACIRMSGDAPISVLQQFLSRKLSYSPAIYIQTRILFYMQGKFVVLNTGLKLREVREQLISTQRVANQDMALYYRIHEIVRGEQHVV